MSQDKIKKLEGVAQDVYGLSANLEGIFNAMDRETAKVHGGEILKIGESMGRIVKTLEEMIMVENEQMIDEITKDHCGEQS